MPVSNIKTVLLLQSQCVAGTHTHTQNDCYNPHAHARWGLKCTYTSTTYSIPRMENGVWKGFLVETITFLDSPLDLELQAWQALVRMETKGYHFRPVAAYRAGTAMAVPHLWGTWTRECAKVGVVVITMQYGRTTSKLLATVLHFLQLVLHSSIGN